MGVTHPARLVSKVLSEVCGSGGMRCIQPIPGLSAFLMLVAQPWGNLLCLPKALSLFLFYASRSGLEAPSSVAVLTCQDSIPGCLGLTVLPWGADQAGGETKRGPYEIHSMRR